MLRGACRWDQAGCPAWGWLAWAPGWQAGSCRAPVGIACREGGRSSATSCSRVCAGQHSRFRAEQRRMPTAEQSSAHASACTHSAMTPHLRSASFSKLHTLMSKWSMSPAAVQGQRQLAAVCTKHGRRLPDRGSESGLCCAVLQSPSLSSAASLALTAAPALVGVVVACAHKDQAEANSRCGTAARTGTAASCLPLHPASTQSHLGSCTGRRPAEGGAAHGCCERAKIPSACSHMAAG